MDKLKVFIGRQLYCPGFCGLFINPTYIAKRELLKQIRSLRHLVAGSVLDIGCGQKPYATLFNCDKYVGLEINTPKNRKNKKIDLYYDGKCIPAGDCSFDWVISNEVFEHVFNPDEYLDEIHRVLKPAGRLFITVPFVWDEHEQPFDYARYSSFGLKFLLEKHRFKIIEHRKTVNDIRVVFQLINVYLFRILSTKQPFVNMLLCLLFMFPFTVIGETLYRLFPRNNDLYIDNLILAQKE